MSKQRKSQQQSDPRIVGATYHSGYFGFDYIVQEILFDRGWLKSITVKDLTNEYVYTHCTAWDPRRDSIVDVPTESANEALTNGRWN